MDGPGFPRPGPAVATAGRLAGTGIYDIGRDTDAEASRPTWTLLRVQD